MLLGWMAQNTIENYVKPVTLKIIPTISMEMNFHYPIYLLNIRKIIHSSDSLQII